MTSAQPEEGKTTVSVNLALTMILAGKKVLILDADLRKPRVHQIFKLENTQGFSDVITGRLAAETVVQTVRVTAERRENKGILSVITSGKITPNFFSTVGLPKLKEAIDYFRNVYDIVLLDSSPVLSVSDALLIAPMVDGIILVLNTGVITEKDAKHAKERLEQAAGGHILGAVMNRFDDKLHGSGFHPYYGYCYDAR